MNTIIKKSIREFLKVGINHLITSKPSKKRAGIPLNIYTLKQVCRFLGYSALRQTLSRSDAKINFKKSNPIRDYLQRFRFITAINLQRAKSY